MIMFHNHNDYYAGNHWIEKIFQFSAGNAFIAIFYLFITIKQLDINL